MSGIFPYPYYLISDYEGVPKFKENLVYYFSSYLLSSYLKTNLGSDIIIYWVLYLCIVKKISI